MSEGRDEKGKFTEKYIKNYIKRLKKLMNEQDDRIHDMIMNPEKYHSDKYNGFINLIDDGKG